MRSRTSRALCELGVRYANGSVFGRPWVTFAVPRPRGLSQLASIWCGEVPAGLPRDDGFDAESGEVATAIRRAAAPRLAEGSQPAAILYDGELIDPSASGSLPLGEPVAQIDACFSGG